MAKKKTNLSQTGLASTLFNTINPYNQDQKEKNASLAVKLPLLQIRPDPGQPRHLLPTDLRQALFDGKISPFEAMQRWLKQAEQASKGNVLQKNLTALQKLANSIEQHGLINAITIRPPRADETLPTGVNYLIVTGERRYWAQVYLATTNKHIQEGKTKSDPNKIKATEVAEGITVRAHQLIENLLREDINAVEKAQGLWALRYELSGVNHGSPANQTNNKVNHGSPLVTWESVQKQLDISKRYRIFVTSVLNLSEQAQEIIMKHNLSERLIRPITQKLKDYPALQLLALKQLITWQAENESENSLGRPLVKSVKELVEQLLGEKTKTRIYRQRQSPSHIITAKQLQDKIRDTVRYLNHLQKEDIDSVAQDIINSPKYATAVGNLQQLRRQIDDILAVIAKSDSDK